MKDKPLFLYGAMFDEGTCSLRCSRRPRCSLLPVLPVLPPVLPLPPLLPLRLLTVSPLTRAVDEGTAMLKAASKVIPQGSPAACGFLKLSCG